MVDALRISIAMATFNGGRFIQDQLESIAHQSMVPYELVITDDGSTDDTLSIIAEFSRSAPFPVHLHCNETRLGYADNFIKAASLCRGDLIAFSDQDDIWLRNKLAHCAEYFKNDDVMLAVHSAKVVDEALKPVGWLFPRIYRDAVRQPLCKGPGSGLSGFAMMFRANMPLIFNRVRPWGAQDGIVPMIHDQWVTFLALIFGKTVYIQEPLALYRRHANTATNPTQSLLAASILGSFTTTSENYRDVAKLNGHWADYLERESVNLKGKERDLAKRAVVHYRWISEILLQRSKLYQTDKGMLQKMYVFLNLLAKSGYCAKKNGGLGVRSLIKDAGVGVMGINLKA